MIACGALGAHLREITARRQWEIELHTLPALLHIAVASGGSDPLPPQSVVRSREHLMLFVANAENFMVCDFEKSFAVVGTLPCDIALANHPDNGDFWERLDRRDHGNSDALIDPTFCRRYEEASKARLEKRVADENKQ